jgi:hypothetical protein
MKRFVDYWLVAFQPLKPTQQTRRMPNNLQTNGRSSTLNSVRTFRLARCGRNHRIRFSLSTTILVKGKPMKKAAVVFSAAAVMAMMAVSVPTPAQARGGWGWGPGIAGGLLAGALIGGLASSAYGYGPGYGYYGPGYGYYGGGYAPGYYGGYAPAYSGYGYGRPYYGRAYYPAYRPAYYRPYYGPRFHDWGG